MLIILYLVVYLACHGQLSLFFLGGDYYTFGFDRFEEGDVEFKLVLAYDLYCLLAES